MFHGVPILPWDFSALNHDVGNMFWGIVFQSPSTSRSEIVKELLSATRVLLLSTSVVFPIPISLPIYHENQPSMYATMPWILHTNHESFGCCNHQPWILNRCLQIAFPNLIDDTSGFDTSIQKRFNPRFGLSSFVIDEMGKQSKKGIDTSGAWTSSRFLSMNSHRTYELVFFVMWPHDDCAGKRWDSLYKKAVIKGSRNCPPKKAERIRFRNYPSCKLT